MIAQLTAQQLCLASPQICGETDCNVANSGIGCNNHRGQMECAIYHGCIMLYCK